MKALISIIVPVYNVEQYLKQCLDSIIEQTYQNIEILLINDGSTDRSGMICDQYAVKDDRIRVFHVYNGGLSHARNIGLRNMSGEFVMFVDSDDFINVDCVEKLYNSIIDTATDISVAFPYRYMEADQTYIYYILDQLHHEVVSPEEIIRRMNADILVPGWTYWSACFKLFKSDLFTSIRFPEGILYEDAATLPKVFIASEKIVQVPEALYCYREREHSIMTTRISIANARSILYACRERVYDIVMGGMDPSIDTNFQLRHLIQMKSLMEENNLIQTVEYLQIKTLLASVEKVLQDKREK